MPSSCIQRSLSFVGEQAPVHAAVLVEAAEQHDDDEHGRQAHANDERVVVRPHGDRHHRAVGLCALGALARAYNGDI